MFQNLLFPLRTIVGDAIPIEKVSNIQKVFESEESKNSRIEYEFSVKSSIAETVDDPHYSRYLPRFTVDDQTILPGEGMDRLPVSLSPLPFANDAQVISFFALSQKELTTDVSRKLSVRFKIKLPQKYLIGGICFGGFPYLPYSHQKMISTGENSSNFGLPREIRLTCLGGSADTKTSSSFPVFMDAEISATRQEIVSHSGFHYLCIDPTLTDSLTVYFSDYPTILTEVQVSSRKSGKKGKKVKYEVESKEAYAYGFIIPYFYVFEYQEKARYRPIVSAGILGTTTNNIAPGNQDTFKDLIDYKHIVRHTDSDPVLGNYFDFTAASISEQQRDYIIREAFYDGKNSKGQEQEKLKECFISHLIQPEKKVVLYIEQGEEYERCIAGVRISLPRIPNTYLEKEGISREDTENLLRRDLKIPQDINFCEKIAIKVYELDPVEGISPLKVELNSKYATLLAEQGTSELLESSPVPFLEEVRFFRSSNSRYFAIELTNLDNKAGQFVIKVLQLIQSAHVSVHPRAAKTQQIRTLNFRIIGPNLAEDYALLGDEGFNFSIERFVAGERKSVLFRANSLMDLLHTGVGRIYGNIRRRSVEFETAETVKGFANFERRTSKAKSAGWRRSELGPNLTAINAWDDEELLLDNDNNKFESFTATEIRSYNRLLYPRDRNEWNATKSYFNLISDIATIGTRNNPIPNDNARLNAQWRNPRWNAALTFPNVGGLRTVMVSPFSSVIALEQFITGLSNRNGADAVSGLVADLLAAPSLILTAGSNTSISAAPFGIGLSLGIAPFPSLQYNSTFGSTGSVSISASESIYSYSQALNHGYDASSQLTSIDEGVSNRKITRTAVDGTDRKRVKGAEVMWQGELVDIITGAIPLNFKLPATASKMHFRTSDDSLRVRFGSGVGTSLSVDFWFDVTEEIVKDDY